MQQRQSKSNEVANFDDSLQIKQGNIKKDHEAGEDMIPIIDSKSQNKVSNIPTPQEYINNQNFDKWSHARCQEMFQRISEEVNLCKTELQELQGIVFSTTDKKNQVKLNKRSVIQESKDNINQGKQSHRYCSQKFQMIFQELHFYRTGISELKKIVFSRSCRAVQKIITNLSQDNSSCYSLDTIHFNQLDKQHQNNSQQSSILGKQLYENHQYEQSLNTSGFSNNRIQMKQMDIKQTVLKQYYQVKKLQGEQFKIQWDDPNPNEIKIHEGLMRSRIIKNEQQLQKMGKYSNQKKRYQVGMGGYVISKRGLQPGKIHRVIFKTIENTKNWAITLGIMSEKWKNTQFHGRQQQVISYHSHKCKKGSLDNELIEVIPFGQNDLGTINDGFIEMIVNLQNWMITFTRIPIPQHKISEKVSDLKINDSFRNKNIYVFVRLRNPGDKIDIIEL